MSGDPKFTISRGRPPKIERPLIIDAILSRKLDVLRPDEKPVSKNDPLWQEIADTLENKITAATLYSFVADNKDNIKNQILQRDIHKKLIEPKHDNTETDVSECDLSCPPASTSMEPGLQTFRIPLPKKEYMDLLCTKIQKRTEKNRDKVYDREVTSLKSGLWEEYISNALWQVQRLKCGFNFRSPRLAKDGITGNIIGSCKCGSIIDIILLPGCENDQFINIECRFTAGTGKCSKRFLRQPIREAVAQKLSTVSAAVFRADKARRMMMPGDPEPGTLYKASVLNKAKQESNMKMHCDPDTFTSLGIMKRESQKLSIHAMGYDPFYLIYWTNYQIHVYRIYAKSDDCTITIDATGSVVRKLIIDGYQTKHIFLYEAVVNCHLGQFPVTQMLSERHDTVTIHMWLERWVQAGVPVPKEVISDSSKALLTAIVRTFSVHKTIEEYANASWENVPPKCYVRLDVAHFIKMYANFLSSTTTRVRVFYLSCIGQLIMARTIEMAAEIVKAILIVAYSESEGNDPDGSPTPCEIHKTRLQKWIPNNSQWTNIEPEEKKKTKKIRKNTTTRTGNDDENNNEDEENEDEANEIAGARNPTIFNDDFTENSWSKWGSKLNDEAKTLSAIEGDRDNAHYNPKLADRLLKDIRWLPLWSCVNRDKYGYGRVPASSAPSESDFNYVKTHLLQKRKPIRADEFVELHINNINGRMNIADAKAIDNSCENVNENTSQHESDASSPSSTIEDNMQRAKNSSEDESSTSELLMKNCTDIKKSEPDYEFEAIDVQSKYTTPCELCQIQIPKKSKSDESNDDRLLCETCKKIDVERILASREEEDWGGKTSQDKNSMEQTKMPERNQSTANGDKKDPTKRCSKYLAPNQHVIDMAKCEKSKQIPIMKNGGCTTLKGINVEGINMTLIKTCAFDSILQILLAIVFDVPTAAETFNQLDVPLLKLALHIHTKGLTPHAYKQRAIIMFDWYKKTLRLKGEDLKKYNKKQLKSLCVDCDSSAAGLANSLFYDIPSVSEITSCEARCTNKEKNLATVSLKPRTLSDPEFANVLIKYVSLSDTQICSKKGGCKKSVTTKFSRIGNFVVFELFDDSSDSAQDIFALGKIPKKISDPLGGNDLQLKGVVNYIQPRRVHRKSDIDYNESGHYTAFCLRSSGTWMEYNDIGPDQKVVSEKHKINVHVIFYFRP